ncbi:DinB family protein [Cellulomonas sp. HZM]|uniref:DinB family protein n=1 Tax=Cellulomonas sp. HZM TaxID=1454010 RepID=UPI000492F487|nr:DinB family protein [Cellulomonas sp. HZM]
MTTPTTPTDPSPARVDPPLSGSEAETLLGFLEFHRATLLTKCGGLTDEQLRQTLPPSTITLGGLLKHLALVEDNWTSEVLLGSDALEPWASVDWSADRDWEWNSAAQDTGAELLALYATSVERSRRIVDDALASGGLDQLSVRESRHHGGRFSLRWILVHLVEEYARHNGHADLVRESIDGSTGE